MPVRIIEQKEINELCNILSYCNIIPVATAKALLRKRGKTDRQIDCIINQMLKNKKCFFDETRTYIRINKGMKNTDINTGLIKSLWLMIDLLNNVGDYYFQHDATHCLTFHNINNKTENPFYDVYYIPYNSETLCNYHINNQANNMKSMSSNNMQVFVIIDNESQINSIKLNDYIDVCSFVKVSPDGIVEYFERG